MNILSTFSERLSEQMNEKNILPNDIHITLKINLSHIYTWLRGENLPSLNTAIELSEYLNCSIDFLFGRTENNLAINFNIVEPFNIRLQKIIYEKKLSNFKFSKEVGIPRSALHYWLKDKNKPSLDSLIKIANYIDCSIDYLIGRE